VKKGWLLLFYFSTKKNKETIMKPTTSKITSFRQLIELIPTHLTKKLAKKHGVDKQARTFSPWSHVVSLCYAQFAHSLSLNDICDGLRNHEGELNKIRGVTPPSKNGLSHANRARNATMAKDLFWSVLDHLRKLSPAFAGKNYNGFPRRFKKSINVLDSSTIQLVANCMGWAQHRRSKAAAKLHLNLDLQSFLPKIAIVDRAKDNDAVRARELCANIKAGEIVIADKAYIDFEHLYELGQRDISWVMRAKDNMCYNIVEELEFTAGTGVELDCIIELKNTASQDKYPKPMRLVRAYVEVKGEMKLMTFFSNNFEWAPTSIAELYKSRWAIEVFFKQLKQTLQLGDFFGHSANAIQWQVWTALLVYVLLRYMAFISKWEHSFKRAYTMVRAILWSKIDVFKTMLSYGTANDPPAIKTAPDQAYLPGFV
jgi:hypothetical protein